MTPEIRQTVLSLRAERQPYKAIVKATGLSSATIYRVLREDCMLFAVARADSVEQSFQQFGKSIHDQNQSLAYNLAKAEQELEKRSFTGLPTENLQRMVTALRREARNLQDKTEQDLARCHDLFERDQAKRKQNQDKNHIIPCSSDCDESPAPVETPAPEPLEKESLEKVLLDEEVLEKEVLEQEVPFSAPGQQPTEKAA